MGGEIVALRDNCEKPPVLGSYAANGSRSTSVWGPVGMMNGMAAGDPAGRVCVRSCARLRHVTRNAVQQA
jgi:hypothetical protein